VFKLKKLKKDELCWDEEGCGGGAICLVAEGRGIRRNRGEGRWPGHILTITDRITDEIILSVNPLAILSI